jgi:hypothetical protein
MYFLADPISCSDHSAELNLQQGWWPQSLPPCHCNAMPSRAASPGLPHPGAVKLDKLREAEAGAVQREDFEAAASLGDELDAASAHLAGLQQRLKVGHSTMHRHQQQRREQQRGLYALP